MRLRQRRSPLLLLLIPSLAATAAFASSSNVPAGKDAAPPRDALDPTALGGNGATASKYDVGTKDAPVDGKDGKPHSGPFVEMENLRSAESKKELPPLKDRPRDTTVVDGVKIPESNDGVMDDKNRPEPKEGTTGTSGGVSEKDKARKSKEDITGIKVENKPETPKEAPPLPHSEQEKILSDKGDKDVKKEKSKDKTKADIKTSEDVSGLEVRCYRVGIVEPRN